jgi:hypothetical protein
VLVPVLRPGQVVLMDNLAAHMHVATQRLLESAGVRVRFLPRHSPEYNPMEDEGAGAPVGSADGECHGWGDHARVRGDQGAGCARVVRARRLYPYIRRTTALGAGPTNFNTVAGQAALYPNRGDLTNLISLRV